MLTPIDSHIHTHLSGCAVQKEFYFRPEQVIRRAKETGVCIAGISNHMWDLEAGSNKGHYIGDDFAHILSVMGDIPSDTCGVKLLVGCETDFSYQSGIGITNEHAEMLDYILVPTAHFHLCHLTLPYVLTEPREIADALVRRFHEICEEDLGDILTHCFCPKGLEKANGTIRDVQKALRPGDVEQCFLHAKERGKAIEIHASYMPTLRKNDENNREIEKQFIEYIIMAKSAGCLFTLGSDAHRSMEMGITVQMAEKAAALAGLTDGDIMPLFRAS